MPPWNNFSIASEKIPNMYPAASTAIIGATVTMLTSIIEGGSSRFFKTTFGLKILSRIPLSRNCANLWKKLYYIKDLIHCDFKSILTKTLQLWLYKIKRQRIGEQTMYETVLL
jgi:hypothetical protein